ncbi:MAG: transcriptional regulator, partial [Deltaproteobacteria bacterium]|nr:transcriptional regulator [Deltaproteobacteria bacterium]
MLHIGRNNKGVVVGVPNAARLLEEIPNKVRDILGIVVDVNLRKERGKEWLEIVVEPHSYPVSYKGEYHVRSGSTKLELRGAALDRFLLRKQGRTWDGAPVPRLSPRDLSKTAISGFRKLAKESRRLDTSVLRESAAGLLDKLNLFDGGHLKRAA